MAPQPDQPLRILHAVRAPVGGIFRHILDLANGQADRGHHVGIIADSLTGGERADAALAEIAPRLKLGVHRLAIHREPSPTDVLVWAHFMRLIRRLKPDVLHGHGAKAGAFVRLKTRSKRHHSRLYAAWRLAALPAEYAQGRALQPPRTRADEQHRSVPVRKRVRARYLSAHHRHADRAGALRVQRRHRGRIRSDRQGRRRHRYRLCRRVQAHQGRRPPDRRGGAAARRRQAGHADARRRRRGNRGAQGPDPEARPRRGGALHRPRQGALRLFQGPRCWWFRRAGIPCPMS